MRINEGLLSMFFGMVTVIIVGILVFRAYQKQDTPGEVSCDVYANQSLNTVPARCYQYFTEGK